MIIILYFKDYNDVNTIVYKEIKITDIRKMKMNRVYEKGC